MTTPQPASTSPTTSAKPATAMFALPTSPALGPLSAGHGPDGADVAPIPFHRLLSVETRKLLDTRSSKILTAILIVLTFASVIGRGLYSGPRFFDLAGTAGIGYGTLLPVLGILTVAAEWSHRTALTTFTLEPRRGRLLAAKCLPPLVMSLAAALLALLIAIPTTAVVAAVQDVPANWEISPFELVGWVVSCMIGVAQGLAVGMLLLNAPAAIVVCLSSTMVWSIVGQMGTVGSTLADWLDVGSAAASLFDGTMTGIDTARLAVSATFWIIVPMAAGVARVIRKEVN